MAPTVTCRYCGTVPNAGEVICDSEGSARQCPWMGSVEGLLYSLEKGLLTNADKQEIAKLLRAPDPASLEADALRWRQLPSHIEEFQIDYVGLKRAIDATLAAPPPPAAPVSPARTASGACLDCGTDESFGCDCNEVAFRAALEQLAAVARTAVSYVGYANYSERRESDWKRYNAAIERKRALDVVNKARDAERERCALIAEQLCDQGRDGYQIATVIRAGKQSSAPVGGSHE